LAVSLDRQVEAISKRKRRKEIFRLDSEALNILTIMRVAHKIKNQEKKREERDEKSLFCSGVISSV